MSKRRRFIAAAECPQCHAIDTLALYLQDQVEVVECVQCGHRQTQAQQHIEKEKWPNEQVIGVFRPD